MAKRRAGRAWRTAGAAALAIMALLALALLSLATPPGHALVASLIERTAAASGVTVSIDRLGGWLPFSLGADRIVLADADGPFAEIDGLAVDIHTSALFVGSLSLDKISAERIALLRQPHLPAGDSGKGALLPFAASDVKVARLELGEALAGRPAALTLTGALVSGADGSIAAKLDAHRIDGGSATLDASVARASETAPLTASVVLKEAADGILPGLMGRPSAPAYALDAKVGLRGDALTGDLSLTSSGAARFDGQFMLSPAGAGQRLTVKGNGDLAELVPPAYASLLAGPIAVAVDADLDSRARRNAAPHRAAAGPDRDATACMLPPAARSAASATDLSLNVKVADPAARPSLCRSSAPARKWRACP